MKPEELFKTNSLTLGLEQIRQVVGYPLWHAKLYKETEDLGRQVSYALSAWFAHLPERGVLELREPVIWIDYILYGIYLKTRWKWTSKRVKWTTKTYKATDYLPNVEVPEPYNGKRFQIWWYSSGSTPAKPYLP